jgi:hydroxyacylglutathione hydrolase
MTDTRVDFVTGAPITASLDVRWIHGVPAGRQPSDPKIQVHYCDPHTVILRQSKSVSYEAPFLYLLFGNERALLLDTGATADPAEFPLRTTVDQLVTGWLAQHPSDTYQLQAAAASVAGKQGASLQRLHHLQPARQARPSEPDGTGTAAQAPGAHRQA